MADEEKNQLTSWALLITPVLVAALLARIIPAYELLMDASWKEVVYYSVFVVIGIVLFLRSRTVRDHEFWRTKSIKNLRKSYAAEDKGLWSKADAAMVHLEQDAKKVELGNLGKSALDRLEGQVGAIVREVTTGEIGDDAVEEEVHLFIDEEHVRRSTSRMSGDAKSEPIDEVKGVTVESSEEEESLIGQVTGKWRDMQKKSIEKRVEKISGTAQATSTTIVSDPEPIAQPEVEVVDSEYAQIYGAAPSIEDPSLVASEVAASGGGKTCGECGRPNPASSAYCNACGGFL